MLTIVSVVMNKQEANLSDLTAANQQLTMEKSILERQTEELSRDKEELMTEKSVLEREAEELSRDRDQLNRTLGVILEFNTFPVNKYCPEKSKCFLCTMQQAKQINQINDGDYKSEKR